MSEYAQTGSQTITSAEPDRGQIVKEFEWAITDLEKVVDELRARLSPIMMPPTLTDERLSEPRGPVSDARGRLMDLHRVTAVLRETLGLLEV